VRTRDTADIYRHHLQAFEELAQGNQAAGLIPQSG